MNANLRGFYFSSGTQEGTPIDQVLGSIGRSFGETAHRVASSGQRQELLPARPADQGDLRRGRLGLARHERGAPRRRSCATARFAVIGLVSAGLLGAWGVSFASNKALIAATDSARRAVPRQRRRRAAGDDDLRCRTRRMSPACCRSCATCRSATTIATQPTPMTRDLRPRPARPPGLGDRDDLPPGAGAHVPLAPDPAAWSGRSKPT